MHSNEIYLNLFLNLLIFYLELVKAETFFNLNFYLIKFLRKVTLLPNKKSISHLPKKEASLPLPSNLGRKSIRRFNRELAKPYPYPLLRSPPSLSPTNSTDLLEFQINFTPLLTHITRMIIFALLFIRASAHTQNK